MDKLKSTRIQNWLTPIRDAYRDLEQRLWWIHLTYTLPHEACHYLAARAFGFKPRFKLYSVRFYPVQKNGWRAFVVIVAPTLLGFVPALFAVAQTLHDAKFAILIPLSLPLLLFWETTCWLDIYAAWHLLRHGKWPAYVFKPQQGFAMLGQFDPRREGMESGDHL